MKFKDLKKIMKEFQHPAEHDAIQKAIVATAETTEVITQALNKIIVRGETLQDLVEKSEELSLKAKIFYKESKKKKCCEIF
jgi:synaptobrevin family protein YKT6